MGLGPWGFESLRPHLSESHLAADVLLRVCGDGRQHRGPDRDGSAEEKDREGVHRWWNVHPRDWVPCLNERHVDHGRGAARQSRPSHGAGVVARRPPRRRACCRRPGSQCQDPRLPRRQGAAAGAAPAHRPGAAHDRGRREPHRQLVLERRGAHTAPADRAAGVRLRAARLRRRGLAVHRDGRGSGEARGRRLDDARGRPRGDGRP